MEMARLQRIFGTTTILIIIVLLQPMNGDTQSSDNISAIKDGFQANQEYKQPTHLKDLPQDGKNAEETTPNRLKKALDCPTPNPPDAVGPCIACNAETTYPHTDSASGFQCTCTNICTVARYMKEPCICNGDGTMKAEGVCSLCIPGVEFMNVSNWCSRPFHCSKCPGDLVEIHPCTEVSDTKCGCPPDMEPSIDNPTTCEPIPTCQENHELHREPVPGSNAYNYNCVVCEQGFTQPKNNSRNPCTEMKPTQPPDEGKHTDANEVISTPYQPAITSKTEDVSTPMSTPVSPESRINCTLQCPCPILANNKTTTSNSTSDSDIKGSHGQTTWCLSIWVVGVIIIIAIILIVFALVYASSHPDHIRRLIEWLHVPKPCIDWIYTRPTDSFTSVPSAQEKFLIRPRRR